MFETRVNVKKHVVVCYSKNTYCAHPITGEIFNFGNNEIAFMHLHTENVEYTEKAVLRHGQASTQAKAKLLLTRSTDGGITWPLSDHVVIVDHGLPLEEKREMLAYRAGSKSLPPYSKNTIFYFGQSFSVKKID